MADVTFGVKVAPETRERIQHMVEASGFSSTKEWFERLLAMYDLQELKEGTPGYEKDITELEIHTNRIAELVVNMIRRTNFEKGKLHEDLIAVVAKHEELQQNHQTEIKELRGSLKEQQIQLQDLQKTHQAAEKQISQYEVNLDNQNALINEYKDKVAVLTQQLAAYEQMAAQQPELQQRLQEAERTVSDLQSQLAVQQRQAQQQLNQLQREAEIGQKEALQELREQLQLRHQSELDKHEEALSAQQTKTEKVEEKLEKQRDRYEALQTLHEDLQAKHQADLVRHTDALEKYRTKLEQAEEQLQQQQKQYEEELATLRSQIK